MPRYLVRALSDIEADTPLDASEVYRRKLAEADPEEWVVRVEEVDTGTMWYCHERHVYNQEDFLRIIQLLEEDDRTIQLLEEDDEDPE